MARQSTARTAKRDYDAATIALWGPLLGPIVLSVPKYAYVPPGGQVLGPTYDYTHRLLDFSLLEDDAAVRHDDHLLAVLLAEIIEKLEESLLQVPVQMDLGLVD